MRSFLMAVSILLAMRVAADTPAERPSFLIDGHSYPVYENGTEVTPLETVAPSYPRAAKDEKRGGTVTVAVLVNEKGRTKRATVASTDAAEDITGAVVTAVRGWKFPVIKSGEKPIAYVVKVKLVMEADVAAAKFLDLISDPQYIRRSMAKKVLVAADPSTGEIYPEILAALKTSGLSNGIEFFPFPPEGVSAQSTHDERTIDTLLAVGPLLGREGGEASFLVMVGQDGSVIGLYCYQSTSPKIAVAQATIITKTKYKPAKIQGIPVPMLKQVKWETKAGK